MERRCKWCGSIIKNGGDTKILYPCPKDFGLGLIVSFCRYCFTVAEKGGRLWDEMS